MKFLKEKKAKIFFALQLFFCCLTFIGLVLVLTQKVDNAGLSIVSMVFSLAFGAMYRSCQQR